MDDGTNRPPNWVPWAMASLVMVIVAMLAYATGQRDAAGGAGAEYWHWGFPGVWGLFLVFGGLSWFRWAFFGWVVRDRPWRYRRYSRRFDDEYEEWREWHRREHQRMDDRQRPIT